ncbi:MAG: ATP-binding protein [Ilumatobacteraceae bacterium]
MSSPPADEATVRLSVPASPQYLSAARLVAASIGAESGLSVDDLEDLRLGVNELASALVEGAAPGSRIELEYVPAAGAITVNGSIEGGGGSAATDELMTRIMDAVADEHRLDASSFVLVKVSSLREQL